MAQKDEVFKQKLKKKGYWNYIDVYKFCFDWLKDEGYDVMEKEYTEKISSLGKEIILKWEATKKVSDYLKNHIYIDWHILGMKDTEVERDGKKESTNKGEVKITVKASLNKDYESRWEDKPLWKFMRGVYDKYIVRTTIEEYEDRLIAKSEKFIGEIKAFLEIEGR